MTKEKVLTLLLTAIFLLSGPRVFSQNYTYTPSSKVLIQNLWTNDIGYDGIYFKNVSSSALTLSWTLLSTNTLSDCMFGMCASGNCLNGIPATGVFPTLQPQDTGWVKLHAFTGNTPGTNVIKFLVGENQKNMDTLTFIVNVTATGIKENTKNFSVKVFPNPASQSISLCMEGNPLENGNLTIYDLRGKEVFKGSIGSSPVDIRYLSPGSYFVWFERDGKMFRSHFIKD